MSMLPSGDNDEDRRAKSTRPCVTGNVTMYPENAHETAIAVRVCAGCPEKFDCLEWAVRHNERHGVWGGTSERKRRPLIAAYALSPHPFQNDGKLAFF